MAARSFGVALIVIAMFVVVAETKNWKVCSQPKEPGMCKAYFPSYFFNIATGECEQFIYGGCGGNDNRFDTLKECERVCGGSTFRCPRIRGHKTRDCDACSQDSDCTSNQKCCLSNCAWLCVHAVTCGCIVKTEWKQ